MALTSAHPAPPLLVSRLLALALTLALASARKIPASITPISRDLYHSRYGAHPAPRVPQSRAFYLGSPKPFLHLGSMCS
jgi:hypothetical protein